MVQLINAMAENPLMASGSFRKTFNKWMQNVKILIKQEIQFEIKTNLTNKKSEKSVKNNTPLPEIWVKMADARAHWVVNGGEIV